MTRSRPIPMLAAGALLALALHPGAAAALTDCEAVMRAYASRNLPTAGKIALVRQCVDARLSRRSKDEADKDVARDGAAQPVDRLRCRRIAGRLSMAPKQVSTEDLRRLRGCVSG